MRSTDRKIVCQSCGKVFVYTAREQLSAKKRGLTNLPRRCPTCRRKRGGKGGGRGRRGILRTAKCTSCGRYFDTYDRPTPGEPVLCQACQSLQLGGRRRGGNRNRRKSKGR